ncbi:type III secretion system chaperone [Prosthecodimorpha staleyi]|uniref:Type III secretion system chaperone n=1 Tax=Prosthecodimorpha staleyi TaxID=2840188 RepID=A0A947D506_9HYPH|nr:type III secretion system chaperone [Prosthecodimorpha staleyi]MBT9288297.1 type III secretion system chaperone [Prosthecodimorpha staleyi]
MQLSTRASALLQELARDHGLKSLDFDRDGLIPMKIRETQTSIAYSPANDSFYLMAIVDVDAGGRLADPWAALKANGPLAARRTRLAIDPNTKAVVLVRDIFLAGLAYWQFAKAIEEFLADFDRVAAGYVRAAATDAGAGLSADVPSDYLTFRA